jgi:hypothetical protein
VADALDQRARRRRAIAVLLAIGLCGVVAMVLVASLTSPGDAPDDRRAKRAPVERRALFAPTSVWNAPLPRDAPIDPDSASLVTRFVREIRTEQALGTGPWIQTTESSTPLYVVPADQRRVPVKLDIAPAEWNATLRSALASIPIPAGARPAAGSDAHITIWQPARDRLWELWRARRAADGWHAMFGGAIEHVSKSPGYYRSDSWPGGAPNWGATATSLPVVAGTILVSELESDRIDHALAMDIPNARAGEFAYPAQRTDGTGGPELLPEGARLRLPASVDLDALGLPPVTRAIAAAAQRYGIVIRDRTHHATAFYAEDPAPLGRDPYGGPDGLFGGELPSALLADFPWQRLQVVEMHLCRRSPCTG